MTRHKITPAELRTLREGVGLSADDLAALAGVQARTVKHWESGRAGVPDDVADLIKRMDQRFTSAAREAVAVPRPASWSAADDVVLVRYASTEDLHRYRPDMGALPHTAHGALIGRVLLALDLAGVSARVVYLLPEAYETWRAACNLPESEASRAHWAAGQVQAQCLPRP